MGVWSIPFVAGCAPAVLRLLKIRRKLLLCAGLVLAFSATALLLAHTGPARRFIFARLQGRLESTLGIRIDAADLHYSLLASRYELRDITVRGSNLADMPAPLKAQRLTATVPFWRMLRGSFAGAQVRIDGLAILWSTDRNGRANWPAFEAGAAGGPFAGPAVRVTSGNLTVQDSRTGLRLDAPVEHLSASWDPARREYGISLDSAGGWLRWRESRIPVERLRLRSAVRDGGFAVDSLYVLSGASAAEIKGAFSGSPPRLRAAADLKLDLGKLAAVLAPQSTAKGRMRATLSADGPLEALEIKAALSGEDLAVGGVPILRPVAELSVSSATGELRLLSLSAGIFSGFLTASGRLWLGGVPGASEVRARLDGADLRRAASELGAPRLSIGPANIDAVASWPGRQWNAAAISGAVRSRGAALSFRATTSPESVQAVFDASIGDGGSMRGNVAFRHAGRTLAGAVHGQTASLARLGAELGDLLGAPGALSTLPFDGTAHWTASVGGTASLPTASLRLQADALSAGSLKGGALQLDADCAPGGVGIRSATLSWAGQHLKVNGEIGGFSSAAPVALRGTLHGQSLAQVFRSLGSVPNVEAAVEGEFLVSGTIGRPEAELVLRSDGLTVFDQSFRRFAAAARWKDGELTLRRLAAEQEHGASGVGRLDLSGSYTPSTGNYVFEVSGQGLQPAVTLPGALPLTGTFKIEGHGSGTWSDPAFEMNVAGSEVRIGTQRVGEVRAGVRAAAHSATAQLEAPSLNAQAVSTVVMQGEYPFDLTLLARNTRLETTPAATLDANLRAGGLLAPVRLQRASVDVRSFTVQTPAGEIVNDGPIELSIADGRIRAGRLALKSLGSSLRLTGELPLEKDGSPGSLSLAGTLALEPLGRFLPDPEAVQAGGAVEVNAVLTGNAADWRPKGTLAIRGGSLRARFLPLPLDGISGELKFEDGLLRAEGITGTAGGGGVRIDGAVPLGWIWHALPGPAGGASPPARFSAQLDGIELATGTGAQTATARFSAKVQGEAATPSRDALQASAEVTSFEARARNYRLNQKAPAHFTLAGSVLRLRDAEFAGGGSSLKIGGSMGLTGDFPLDVHAAGETDLALVGMAASPLEVAGTVRLDLHLGGTLKAPRPEGFVQLDRAGIVLPSPRIQAANINLRAEVDGERVVLKTFAGNLNGGTFEGGGELRMGIGGLRDVNVFLKGKDAFLEYPAGVKTTSNVDARLVSRGDRLVLEGGIDVQEGFYDSALDLFSSSRQPDARAATGADTPSTTPIALDLKIATRRPLEMDNNLGRLSATAGLRLGGTTEQLRLSGTLNLEQDGKLYFGDRTYYIERGTVRFPDAPRITPEFNIQAYTRTSNYTIRLGLTGTLNELTTTFTSDPPLPRDDVIAVLLTGKTVAENRGADLRALEAASLATGAMNTQLSGHARRALGVSRVSIQPGAVAAESDPGARITITQDFTHSLRLLYSMNLADSNDQIWVGEYDLSRRFTTRAVKQSDNSYRGEFRHDVRFGSSASLAATAAAPAAARKISQVRFDGGLPFTPDELAKTFNIKKGQKYKPSKVRKASDRLSRLFVKKGYLESRVRLDRQDEGDTLQLTVRIELGPLVELSFEGADLPGKQRSRMGDVWHSGISDQQRPQAARQALLAHFTRKGYLQAEAVVKITKERDRKRVRFDLKPGPQYRGVKTVIEGAESQRAGEILSLIRERRLELAVHRDRARVRDAVAGYYRERGYLAAQVLPPAPELDPQRHTGRIVIAVREGTVYRVGAVGFSGNRALPAASLRAALPLRSGEVFEPSRLEPALAAVKLSYGRLGYRETDVDYATVRDDIRAAMDVSFTIEENRQTSIGAIEVEGNRRTSDKFVRGQLRVAEGQVANVEKVRESVKNLAQSGAYSSADIRVQPPADAGAGQNRLQVADLVVAVSEPKPFRLLYGGLYDSGNGPGFIADLQNHNFLGAGRVLGLRTRVDSETDEARLYLTQPTWRSRRVSTTFSAYYTRETEYLQTTPTEKFGVSIQNDVQLRSKLLLSYGYRYEKQRGFVPDPAAPVIPEEIVTVAPLVLTISRDARDSFLDATRGSFLSHGFEFAPHVLGSDYPYARYYVQYFRYFPLTRPRPVPFGEKPRRSGLVFATGSRLGLQKGFNDLGTVLTDRFYAGGGTTVRGFRQDELGPKLANGQPAGGNAVLVLNEEIRYPLFWIFDAVSFVDIGNLYPRVSDFSFRDLRTAAGFGLRIRNPFVVLRFDYGFKIHRRPGETTGAFFFSIGQAF